MSMMQAVVMTAVGKPEVLRLREIPRPEITQPGQLRVRLRAAGVNPLDTKLRARGTYFPERLPAILGCDGAGIVEAVGSAATRFRKGDEVYFCYGGIGQTPGTYASYIVLDERWCALKPRSLTFEQAACVPLALITAWEALHDRARIHDGQRVLIHGGAGGVGHLAVQLARLAGATVAVTVSSADKARLARELGAECVIDYTTEDWVAAIQDWTDGQGVDIALDTVGSATFTQTFGAVRRYGDLVTLLQPDAQVDWQQARLRNLRISFELMLTPMYMDDHPALAHQTDILTQCAPLFDSGRLRILVSHVLRLPQAPHAHRLIEQGGMRGKIALKIT